MGRHLTFFGFIFDLSALTILTYGTELLGCIGIILSLGLGLN